MKHIFGQILTNKEHTFNKNEPFPYDVGLSIERLGITPPPPAYGPGLLLIINAIHALNMFVSILK